MRNRERRVGFFQILWEITAFGYQSIHFQYNNGYWINQYGAIFGGWSIQL